MMENLMSDEEFENLRKEYMKEFLNRFAKEDNSEKEEIKYCKDIFYPVQILISNIKDEHIIAVPFNGPSYDKILNNIKEYVNTGFMKIDPVIKEYLEKCLKQNNEYLVCNTDGTVEIKKLSKVEIQLEGECDLNSYEIMHNINEVVKANELEGPIFKKCKDSLIGNNQEKEFKNLGGLSVEQLKEVSKQISKAGVNIERVKKCLKQIGKTSISAEQAGNNFRKALNYNKSMDGKDICNHNVSKYKACLDCINIKISDNNIPKFVDPTLLSTFVNTGNKKGKGLRKKHLLMKKKIEKLELELKLQERKNELLKLSLECEKVLNSKKIFGIAEKCMYAGNIIARHNGLEIEIVAIKQKLNEFDK